MSGGRKKKSLAFLAFASFLCLFVVFSVVQHFYYAEKFYRNYNEERISKLAARMKVAYALLEDGREALVVEDMEYGYGNDEISFYRIDYADGRTSDSSGKMPDIDYERDVVFYGDNLGYLQIVVNDNVLTAGIAFDFDDYHLRAFHGYKEYLFRDLILITIIIVCLFIYFTRDFVRILSALRKGTLNDLDDLKANSNEASIFSESIGSFSGQIAKKAAENELLKRQLLPALKAEIFSGLTPPYEFDCTLVRTDINHFSSILKENDKKEFFDVINRFFTDCTNVISRYGGVVSEFLGDEVIFYFKEREEVSSAVLALAAIRDINDIALMFDKETKSAYGYRFCVKSSVSHGELNFGKQVDRYTVSGTPLIETVRILSEITTRRANTVWVSGDIREFAGNFIQSTNLGEFQLKGLAPVHLYEVTEFQRTPDCEFDFTFFRSDSDFLSLIGGINSNVGPLSSEDKEKIRFIRNHPPYGCSSGFKVQWFAFLGKQGKHQMTRSDFAAAILRATVGIAYDCSLSEAQLVLIREFIFHRDPRVVANAIDALRELGDKKALKSIVPMQKHDNLRIRVAAIAYLLCEDWDQHVLLRLQHIAYSKKGTVQKAAGWAVNVVYEYYNNHNPLVISSNPLLSDLKRRFEDKGLKRSA